MLKWKYIIGIAILLLPNVTLADVSADLGFIQNDIYLSNAKPVDSTSVRIYATIHNAGSKDSLGSVRFYETNPQKQIGADQPISLIPTRADDVFVDWNPTYGTHTVSVQIIPWTPETDNPSNNIVSFSVFVDRDTDKDGIGDLNDIDDDNDGVADSNDLFPLNASESADTDGDNIGNNADQDDDNDDVLDIEDAFPLDPTESADFDKDGVGNNADSDDDNDGLTDVTEDKNQNNIVDSGETDSLNPDSDNDSVLDGEDAFPLDPTETEDFDNDSIGDNADTDDDNDEIPDAEDINSKNQGPIISLGDTARSVDVNNPLTIDTSESLDLDGEIANTVIVIEKINNNIGATGASSFSSTRNSTNSQNTTTTGSNTDIQNLKGENNASTTPNGNQFTDKDEDGVVDANDNCINVPNPNQIDTDNDGLGDSCDGSTIGGDNTIILNSVNQLIQNHFGNKVNIITLKNNKEKLTFDTESNVLSLYSYVGENFEANFDQPGTYRVTVIAQDNKNETRTKEIIIKVRDYNKILKTFLVILGVLLAILMAVKYILLAKKRDKRGETGNDKPKTSNSRGTEKTRNNSTKSRKS